VFIFAKALQALGLVDVGYAIFAGLRDGTAPSPVPVVVGLAIFYVGRLVERRT
jgi:hypothetical protein